jgi:hypothetical protein
MYKIASPHLSTQCYTNSGTLFPFQWRPADLAGAFAGRHLTLLTFFLPTTAPLAGPAQLPV